MSLKDQLNQQKKQNARLRRALSKKNFKEEQIISAMQDCIAEAKRDLFKRRRAAQSAADFEPERLEVEEQISVKQFDPENKNQVVKCFLANEFVLELLSEMVKRGPKLEDSQKWKSTQASIKNLTKGTKSRHFLESANKLSQKINKSLEVASMTRQEPRLSSGILISKKLVILGSDKKVNLEKRGRSAHFSNKRRKRLENEEKLFFKFNL